MQAPQKAPPSLTDRLGEYLPECQPKAAMLSAAGDLDKISQVPGAEYSQ